MARVSRWRRRKRTLLEEATRGRRMRRPSGGEERSRRERERETEITWPASVYIPTYPIYTSEQAIAKALLGPCMDRVAGEEQLRPSVTFGYIYVAARAWIDFSGEVRASFRGVTDGRVLFCLVIVLS